jgi:GNAT superfamily N-acetyltransferase
MTGRLWPLWQPGVMNLPNVVIQQVDKGTAERTVQFLVDWVSDSEPDAREHLAGHVGADGASLIAVRDQRVIGIVTILWESNYAGFRDRGIPLVHQITVAEPCRRQGVGMLLLAAAEELARCRGIAALGITVGLFDKYGPAQRLYARRGYWPDGRGACLGQEPLSKGAQVTIDDDLIIWLTKELSR